MVHRNRLGTRLNVLELKAFPDCKRLCVVRTVKEYLRRTLSSRQDNQLLLSFVRPFGPVSRDTIARWTLKVMALAGIDVDKYGGHST